MSRRLPAVPMIVACLLVLSACSPSAPATPASTAAAPTPALTPVEPTVATGESTQLVARNVAFEPVQLAVPAGQPVTISFQNADAGIPHNVHVTGPSGDVIKSELIIGPATIEVPLGTLEPGSYPFICDVHPNMTGTIEAG